MVNRLTNDVFPTSPVPRIATLKVSGSSFLSSLPVERVLDSEGMFFGSDLYLVCCVWGCFSQVNIHEIADEIN